MTDPAAVHPRHARLANRLIQIAVTEDWPDGAHLTEQDCARRLDVSRSPARAALRVLAQLGVVGSRPGRGFSLLRAGRDLVGVVPDAPEPAAAMLRAALIRDRLDGRLGVVQSQVELMRRYQVGLPTLQRVLSRMAQEGLVSHEQWQWSFAPTLETRQARHDSYQLRLILEPAALLLQDAVLDKVALHVLLADHRAFLADMPQASWTPLRTFELDARFHETLAGFSQNPFIRTIIRQQNDLRRFLEVGSYGDKRRVRAWVREHQAIIRALLKPDCGKAATLLRAHLSHAAAAAAA